jgi:hypothetical protein
MLISWPAVIKYSGDDELLFIKDESVWLSESLCAYAYNEDDLLIDSNGLLFSIDYDEKNNKVVLNTRQQLVAIEKFEEWIRNHTAVLNQCCSSKLTLPSIKQGFLLLGQLSH